MNRLKLRALIPAVLLLSGAAPLAGQDPLAPGARVRISVPAMQDGAEVAGSGAWKVGTVVRVDTSMLVLEMRNAGEVSFPLAVVRKAEVSRGMRTSSTAWKRGVRQGALAGAGLALGVAAIGKLSGNENRCAQYRSCVGISLTRPTGLELARNLSIGAAVGGGLGVIFGSRAREEWSPVVLPGMQLSVVPGPRATGLAVSVRL